MRAGLAWTAVLRWTAQLLSWASTLFLVRLLSREDYGIAGLAGTVAVWISVLADFGLAGAIVLGDELPRAVHRKLHGLAITIGLVAGVALAGLGPAAALFFRNDAVAGVAIVLSFVTVADFARVVPGALASRELKYPQIATCDLVRSLVQTISVLSLAIAGFGFWSLALGQLAGSIVNTIMLWRVRPVRPDFDPRGVPVGVFGRARLVLMGSLAWQTYRNLDLWLLGRMLGAGAAGSLSAARTLAYVPIEKLVTVVTSVAPGHLVAARDDLSRLRMLFGSLTEATFLAVAVPLTGLILTADLAVPIILGDQWTDAVPATRWLCVSVMIWTASMIATQVCQMTNKLRQTSLASVLAVPVAAVAYFAGIKLAGLTGAAAASVLVVLVVALPTVQGALVVSETNWWQFFGFLRPAALASAAMTGVLLPLRLLLPGKLGPMLTLLILTAAGAIVTGAALWFTPSGVVADARNWLVKKLRKSPPAVPST
ncbi:oligosaccharide flippase family protein [Gemmatimonas sp.]|jgi:teichuronic acid exporter|uniref:oligosaccharide flippase family protein n=1 Tax=Gemmatimonas sp. TaxID=1962908 RepID=UPI0022C39C3C|nr:oligosaccharide flippase family protein [Gemmatimonas sp.]MCZ8204105.1 oligosaccharide flippase family protein [Gemmatimonas sp.]